eukprot:sb/3466995/
MFKPYYCRQNLAILTSIPPCRGRYGSCVMGGDGQRDMVSRGGNGGGSRITPNQAIKCRLMDVLAPNEHRERDIAFFKTQMGRGVITVTPHTYCDEEYSVSVRLSTGEDLGDLLQQTDQFSHEPPEIEDRKVEIELIEEGYVVVAPRKGILHRARVTDSTSATTLTVQYVDIGDSATLPHHDVRILPEMFANEPAFAVRCHIDVIPSTTPAQLRQFIKSEHPDLAMCTFVRKVSGFGYEVEIRSTGGGSTLAAKLQAHGFVEGSSQQLSNGVVRRPNHDLPDELSRLSMNNSTDERPLLEIQKHRYPTESGNIGS